jgi:hypothetical protein
VVDLDKDFMEYLIKIGAVQHAFNDETNKKQIYRFTKDAAKLIPEIYEQHMKDFNAMVFSLWNHGVIDITFSEEGDPMISLNENSYDFEMIKKLSEEEAIALYELVQIYEKLENE